MSLRSNQVSLIKSPSTPSAPKRSIRWLPILSLSRDNPGGEGQIWAEITQPLATSFLQLRRWLGVSALKLQSGMEPGRVRAVEAIDPFHMQELL